MPIRMSGLVSGLDTEGIVKELMSAQSLKKTKVVQAKTKLEWKQTKWTDLNTKLTSLYNNYVTKMRLTSSYKTKKATVSDSSKVSVSAGTSAVNGSYSLEIKNIATSQYLTGAKIGAKDSSAKLSELDPNLVGKEVVIQNGDTTVKFAVEADSTISDFTKAVQSAGLTASYDTTQQRLFISSKESGLKNAFSITTNTLSSGEINGRAAIRQAVGYSGMTTANKGIVDKAIETLQTSGTDSEEYTKALEDLAKASYETKKSQADAAAENYVKATIYSEKYGDYLTEAKDSLKGDYFKADGTVKQKLADKYKEDFNVLTDEEKADLEEKMGISGITEEDYVNYMAQYKLDEAAAEKADKDTTSYVASQMKEESVKLQVQTAAFTGKDDSSIAALSDEAKAKYYKEGETGFSGTENVSEENEKTALATAVSDYASLTDRGGASGGKSALSALGLADVAVDADGKVLVNGGANDSSNSLIPEGMALVAASDSKILLNGAELTSSTSTVSANGLSIELTGLTETDKPITFSVANDIDGVYDSIKKFIGEYNAVMKEMNSLYNAESSKGYEPLTSEEKEAMTDEDVKLWEDKIKNSLLRGDSTLDGIIRSMRNAMMTTVQYNGKNYALSSFGIMTSTDYTEGGLLHIYGDSDDSVYSDRDDKLKKALADDPEAVIATLTGVFENLRKNMSDKMAGSKYSSALTFYNDIQMKDQKKSYEKEIEGWEDRLAEIEDSYYKKFTAMETAMAKLQSQQSSLASLFGS